jgi:hypothetical protein
MFFMHRVTPDPWWVLIFGMQTCTSLPTQDKEAMKQFGNIVSGAYTPVLAKHSKHFSLEDSLAIGVDRMQNFGPLKQQVEEWQTLQLSAAPAKLLIY